MAKPSVSVAMATYNGAKYVKQQLLSISNQSCPPNEIIVSDDGSSDETLEIIREFANFAPFPVKILSNAENMGYAQNFGIALSQCGGDIVFLSDQDDVWRPNKIEVVLSRFAAEPQIELLIHDLEFCNGDLIPIGQTKIERVRGMTNVDKNYVVGMATAIRARFLKHCLPIPNVPGLSHDRWVHTCAYALGRKQIMPEVLALYRRHSSNVSIFNPLNSATKLTPCATRILSLTKILRKPMYKAQLLLMNDSDVTLLANWLADKRLPLIAEGFATGQEIDTLSALEAERSQIILERKRILKLPRWKRLSAVGRLLASGKYRKLFTWKSAVRDFLVLLRRSGSASTSPDFPDTPIRGRIVKSEAKATAGTLPAWNASSPRSRKS